MSNNYPQEFGAPAKVASQATAIEQSRAVAEGVRARSSLHASIPAKWTGYSTICAKRASRRNSPSVRFTRCRTVAKAQRFTSCVN